MTTNKLPDVVWLSPSVMRSDGWHMSYIAHAFGNSHCYVQKSALDAMTAERDRLVIRLERALLEGSNRRDERDSAREALAKAKKFILNGTHEGHHIWCEAVCGPKDENWYEHERCECGRNKILAAQPETKP